MSLNLYLVISNSNSLINNFKEVTNLTCSPDCLTVFTNVACVTVVSETSLTDNSVSFKLKKKQRNSIYEIQRHAQYYLNNAI